VFQRLRKSKTKKMKAGVATLTLAGFGSRSVSKEFMGLIADKR
jgi:hypothetical protein